MYLSEQILNELRFKLPENNLFDLIFVQNTGAAFSIFENSKIFLIAFSVIALILILIYVIKNITKYSAFAAFWTAMLVSGISCNLYERIAFGYVRDFIKLNFVEFPVFNISDIFINLSVFALVIIIIKNNYLKK
ncbi:MAG: signal peptidase II [Candidatus Gastranaerophilales bacterium]|nr:signal peptidase II [Candidatus Gastranaerophilales bacterium]